MPPGRRGVVKSMSTNRQRSLKEDLARGRGIDIVSLSPEARHEKIRRPVPVLCLTVLGTVAACARRPDRPPAGSAAIGIDELVRLDLLPRLKRSVKVGSRLELRPDRRQRRRLQRQVLVRPQGAGRPRPGRSRGPRRDLSHPHADADGRLIEFYFDGEASPRLRLKVIELFDGTRPPFLAPVVGSGVGGYTCYVPLTYRRSCKVVVKAESVPVLRHQLRRLSRRRPTSGPTRIRPARTSWPGSGERPSLLRRAGHRYQRRPCPVRGVRRRRRRSRPCWRRAARRVLFETSKPGPDRRPQDRAGRRLRGRRTRRPPPGLLGRRGGAGRRRARSATSSATASASRRSARSCSARPTKA